MSSNFKCQFQTFQDFFAFTYIWTTPIKILNELTDLINLNFLFNLYSLQKWCFTPPLWSLIAIRTENKALIPQTQVCVWMTLGLLFKNFLNYQCKSMYLYPTGGERAFQDYHNLAIFFFHHFLYLQTCSRYRINGERKVIYRTLENCQ